MFHAAMRLTGLVLAGIASVVWAAEPSSLSDAGNPGHPAYQYVGRIDRSDPAAPKLYYAGSYIVTSFEGTSLRATFDDLGDWWSKEGNYVGFVIDGGDCIDRPLKKGQTNQTVEVASNLPEGKHSLTIVRLSGPGGGAGTLVFRGLKLDAGKGLAPATLPARKIEVYGDSVTEGFGTMAPEGKHDEGYGNGWLAYANVMARRLDVQIQNVGIGGLAVRDGFGYYNGGKTEFQTTYNKLKPFPPFTDWDFSQYQPDLLIFALGVNDQATKAFDDPETWKTTYKAIMRDISRHYGGKVPIILAAAPIWAHGAYVHLPKMAEELTQEGMPVYYYRYSFEVSGHPNRPESDKMARELEAFIRERKLLP